MRPIEHLDRRRAWATSAGHPLPGRVCCRYAERQPIAAPPCLGRARSPGPARSAPLEGAQLLVRVDVRSPSRSGCQRHHSSAALKPRHDRLRQAPRPRRVAREADPDLVARERDLRRLHARQPAAAEQPHRRRPRHALAEPDDELALLARHRRDAGAPPPRAGAPRPRRGRTTGCGIGPNRSVSSWRNAARSPAVAGARQAPVQLQLLGLLGDVVVGEVRLDRQVDDGLRLLDLRRPILAPRLALLDRLREQPRVQVEPDRGHVARLLPAEDVAGAADLEVGQRDLEAGTQLRRVEDRLEPLAGLLAHPLAPPVEQVRVGPPRRPPDPARGAGRAGPGPACRRGR